MSDSIFSIDVEDWFNLSGTGAEPPPSEWDGLESRLERNFHGLLELLAEGNATATCFVVGYFAKRFPQLVREAVAAGHEIASHGYFHRLVYQMSSVEFYKDARAARELLEDVSGQPVRGFRAPAFSVTERTPWFFDKLVEAGYRYNLSVFPAPHQTGGLATGTIRALHREGARRARSRSFRLRRCACSASPCAFSAEAICGCFPIR